MTPTRNEIELAQHFAKYLRMAIEDLRGIKDVSIGVHSVEQAMSLTTHGERWRLDFESRMPEGYCPHCGGKLTGPA